MRMETIKIMVFTEKNTTLRDALKYLMKKISKVYHMNKRKPLNKLSLKVTSQFALKIKYRTKNIILEIMKTYLTKSLSLSVVVVTSLVPS